MVSLAPVAPREPLDAPSGLPGIPRVAWGTHLCQFYRTADDLASTLVPYFAAGLLHHERCLWITAEPFGARDAVRALAAAVPDLERRMDAGQLEVMDYDDWYLRSAKLTTEEVLAGWLAREEAALRDGYRGLRLTGNTSWLRRGDWAEFEAYERRVHQAFASRRVIAVCSYPLARGSTDEILDVVRHHGLALARRDGEWAVLRSATETLATVLQPLGGDDVLRLDRAAPDAAAAALADGLDRAGVAAPPGPAPAGPVPADDRPRATPADALSHLGTLQRVTSALLAARSADELGAVAVGMMAEAAGASAALLASALPDGALAPVAEAGCPAVARAPGGLLALEPRSPVAEALAGGRPVIAASPDALAARWPGLAAGGLAALAAFPLESAGVQHGALVFGFDRPRSFGAVDQALLDDLARQGTLALERAHLVADLERARRVAEDASRAKDEFLAMLGHELRNPLSPMLTVLRIMERRAPDAFRHEREILERQLRNVERLVGDLLDVSRIVQGKLRLERAPVALGEVVAEALESASPLLESRRHRVTVSVPERELVVHADRHRLVQALVNLLNNAARYTPPGGDVSVRAEARGERAVVSVEDDGQGIPPELATKLFEPFVQGPRGLARSEGGLGLGLAIARSIVQLHGGTIEAHSDGAGRGSTFSVALPLATGAASIAARGGAPALGDGGRVLVVDDNADAAETLAEVLRCSGHEVRTAHDPAAALEAAAELAPDVVVVDIGLPGMDGWTLGARLAAQQPGHPPDCIAVTGYGTALDRARSRRAGFVAHLVKPIDVERLELVLAGLVAARGPRAGG